MTGRESASIAQVATRKPIADSSNRSIGGPAGWVAAVTIALAIGAVYGRSLDAPLIFDDQSAIVTNPSIVSLWPLIGTPEQPGPLRPPKNVATAGRPLVSLSFALNYQFGGLNPVGYRAVNMLIHFCTAMLLFAIVRRTLVLPNFNGRFGAVAGWLALSVAMLWALHPLQTEAVVYVTQRTELMMAFFYLATLYCSLRYWAARPRPSGEGRGEGELRADCGRFPWLLLAVAACACGMASKEVMVSAPLVILLYDRTFVSQSLADAVRRSRPLYVGLASTWLVLIGLNLSAPRGASAGFELVRTPFSWWLTQCQVLLMYLKLAIWPAPLLLHYELPYLESFADAWMYVLPVLLLAIVAIRLVVRNTPAGFLLAAMAAVLAPTFFVPILTEVAAERRMYLPLAAVVVLFVMGCYLVIETLRKPASVGQTNVTPRSPIPIPVFAATAILITICGVASAHRLADYQDEARLWQQVADRQPDNYLAHYYLGVHYNHAGDEPKSFAELQKAVAANPNFAPALSAIGFSYLTAGRFPEAVQSLEAALRIEPEYVPAINNLGLVRMQMGHNDEALALFQRALKINATNPLTLDYLGRALINAGRHSEAIESLRLAHSLAPDDVDVLNHLATALSAVNQLPEAIDLLRRAVELRPDYAGAQSNLGIVLLRTGDFRGAANHFQRYLELRPDDPNGCFMFADALARLGEHQQAARLFERGLKLQPDSPEANFFYANTLAQLGRWPDALQRYEKTIQLRPALLPAYAGLAESLARTNRLAEGIEVAHQGIKAARAAGEPGFASQLEAWLKQHAAPPPDNDRATSKSPASK